MGTMRVITEIIECEVVYCYDYLKLVLNILPFPLEFQVSC